MIINRSHLPWALFIAAATALLIAAYLEVFRPGIIPNYIPVPKSAGNYPYGHRSVGATPLGIAYGTAAFLIFIFAALLGPRKEVRHWRIGSAQAWMRAHIWLSVLTIPLVLLHCGLRSGSPMTTGLLALYTVVMLSGFYGLALQQFIPRQMSDRIPHEVIYDQIPFLRKELAASAIGMRAELAPAPAAAAGRGPAPALTLEDPKVRESRAALVDTLDRDVIPYLKMRKGWGSRLARRKGSDDLFELLRMSVAEEYRGAVSQMQRWCDERRQTDLQIVMQHWLHYWLLVHVPASVLLLIWTAWHAVTGLFYF
jgi:hypothetical protein